MTSTARGSKKKTPMDRLIRGCFKVFFASLVVLIGTTVYAVVQDKLGVYLMVAAGAYFFISLLFLTIVSVAFLSGHLGSSRDVEAPKMEIFKLEEHWHK